jgi:hypothetical protein
MNIIIRVLTSLSLVIFSSAVFSAGPIAQDNIDYVAFQTGGFFLYADGWGNPNSCTRSNAVVLQDIDANYDKAYALLLMAYASGKKVSGYSNKCVNFDGQTYNMIRGYKYLTISD